VFKGRERRGRQSAQRTAAARLCALEGESRLRQEVPALRGVGGSDRNWKIGLHASGAGKMLSGFARKAAVLACAVTAAAGQGSLEQNGATLSWVPLEGEVEITLSVPGTAGWFAVGLGSQMDNSAVVLHGFEANGITVSETVELVLNGFNAPSKPANDGGSISEDDFEFTVAAGRRSMKFRTAAIAGRAINLLGSDDIVAAWSTSSQQQHAVDTRVVFRDVAWDQAAGDFKGQPKFTVTYLDNGFLSWTTSSTRDSIKFEVSRPLVDGVDGGWLGLGLSDTGRMNGSSAIMGSLEQFSEFTLVKPIADRKDSALFIPFEGQSSISQKAFTELDGVVTLEFVCSSIAGRDVKLFGRETVILSTGAVDSSADLDSVDYYKVHVRDDAVAKTLTLYPVVVLDSNFRDFITVSRSFPSDNELLITVDMLAPDNLGFLGFGLNGGNIIYGHRDGVTTSTTEVDSDGRVVGQSQGILFSSFRATGGRLTLDIIIDMTNGGLDSTLGGGVTFDGEQSFVVGGSFGDFEEFDPTDEAQVAQVMDGQAVYTLDEEVASTTVGLYNGAEATLTTLATSVLDVTMQVDEEVEWAGLGITEVNMIGTSFIGFDISSGGLEGTFTGQDNQGIDSGFLDAIEPVTGLSDRRDTVTDLALENGNTRLSFSTRSFNNAQFPDFSGASQIVVGAHGLNSFSSGTSHQGADRGFARNTVFFQPATRSPTQAPTLSDAPTASPTRSPRIQEFKAPVFQDKNGVMSWSFPDGEDGPARIEVSRPVVVDGSPAAGGFLGVGINTGSGMSNAAAVVGFIGNTENAGNGWPSSNGGNAVEEGTLFKPVGGVDTDPFTAFSGDSTVEDASFEIVDGVMTLAFTASSIAGVPLDFESLQDLVIAYHGSDSDDDNFVAHSSNERAGFTVAWNPVVVATEFFSNTENEVTLYRSFPTNDAVFLQLESTLTDQGWLSFGLAGPGNVMIGSSVVFGELYEGSDPVVSESIANAKQGNIFRDAPDNDLVNFANIFSEDGTLKLEASVTGFGSEELDLAGTNQFAIAVKTSSGFGIHDARTTTSLDFAEVVFEKENSVLGGIATLSTATQANNFVKFEIKHIAASAGWFGIGIPLDQQNPAMIGSTAVVASSDGENFQAVKLVAKSGSIYELSGSLPDNLAITTGPFQVAFTTQDLGGTYLNFRKGTNTVVAYSTSSEGIAEVHSARGTALLQLIDDDVVGELPPQGTLEVFNGDGQIDFFVDVDGLVDITFSYAASSGYLSLGINDNGNMVGSSVIIGDANGVVEATLSEKSASGIDVFTGASTIEQSSFEVVDDRITLKARLTQIAGRALIVDGTEETVTFAYGSSAVANAFHEQYGSGTVNWALGLGDDDGAGALFIHAVLMIAGMLFIMPVAAIPSVFRESLGLHEGQPATWFLIHRSMQLFACVMVIGSAILAFSTQSSHFDSTHKILGTFIILFCVAQPFLAIFFRKDPATRHLWLASHLVFAALITIGSIITSFLGIQEATGFFEDSQIANLQTAVYIGAVIVAAVAVSVQFKRLRGSGNATNAEGKSMLASKVVRWDQKGANTTGANSNPTAAVSFSGNEPLPREQLRSSFGEPQGGALGAQRDRDSQGSYNSQQRDRNGSQGSYNSQQRDRNGSQGSYNSQQRDRNESYGSQDRPNLGGGRRGPPREHRGPPRDRRGPPRDRRGPPRDHHRGPPRERSRRDPEYRVSRGGNEEYEPSS